MAPDPEEPTPAEPSPDEPAPEPGPAEPAPAEPAPDRPSAEEPPAEAPVPPPYDASAPPRTGLSMGAGIGVGVGIGCGAHIIAILLMFATLTLAFSAGSTIFALVWPFVLVALVAIAMLFFQKTRGVAIGMLIVAAAAWIVVLGPCLGMSYV